MSLTDPNDLLVPSHGQRYLRLYITSAGVFLHGELLTQLNAHKYLGVTLDKRLRFQPHVTDVTRRLKTKANSMAWLLRPEIWHRRKVSPQQNSCGAVASLA